MRKLLIFLIFSIAVVSYIACDEDSDCAPIAAVPTSEDWQDFSILVFSDIHVDCANCKCYKNFQNVIDNLNNGEYGEAEFVIITGDMVNGMYTMDLADYSPIIEEGAEPSDYNNLGMMYKMIHDQSNLPIYNALGNHDYYYNPESEHTWDIVKKMEAVWNVMLDMDPYYTIEKNGFKFIVLSSSTGDYYFDYNWGSFDEEQLVWLENELAEGLPSILFFHYPLWTDNAVPFIPIVQDSRVHEDDRIYDILYQYKDLVKGVFTGHGHVWARDVLYETIPVYETCGTEPLDLLGDTDSAVDRWHRITCHIEDGSISVEKGDPDLDYFQAVSAFFQN